MSDELYLPDIFPQEEIIVEDEEHRFTVNEGGDFESTLEQTEYTLDKAPIVSIEEVKGTHDGFTIVFEEGSDYELSADDERIVWLDDGRHPDPGTIFRVTYRSESIIGRYIDAHAEELDEVRSTIEQIQDNKAIDRASGSDLDEIGALFGRLGRRLGRDDTQYRIYLKSVVQSFVSRGRPDDIKRAIAAATDVPESDIEIRENFEEVQYEVVIRAATPVTGSLVEEVSEIADPSGVSQARTRFTIPDDVVGVDDSFAIGETETVPIDSLTASDDTAAPRRSAGDDIVLTDDFAIDPRTTAVSDDVVGSDQTSIPASTATSDTSIADDTVTSTETLVVWDDGSWDEMNWSR